MIQFFFEDLASPTSWPLNMRRIFVLTLPISVPLWLSLMGLVLVSCLIAIPVLWAMEQIIELWSDKMLKTTIDFLPITVPEGWYKKVITINSHLGPTTTLAWVHGDFAVHPSADKGFMISLAEDGLSLSYNYRVFKRAEDACAFVEALDKSLDWKSIHRVGFKRDTNLEFKRVFDSFPEQTWITKR